MIGDARATRYALVTGGSSGIGLETARGLKAHFDVVGIVGRNAGRLAAAADDLAGLGLDWPGLEVGSADSISINDQVVVAGHGGLEQAVWARLLAKREFAGYWEYVLDEALFTAPAHPNWGGAAFDPQTSPCARRARSRAGDHPPGRRSAAAVPDR